MKKRIISLILVAVMTVLTLAGCAFSYVDEDMTNYATFDKDNFLKAIAKIVIEDGEFTDGDLEKREKMVLDAIYADLAAVADTETKYVGKVDDPETDEDESEPKIGEHDLVFYYYYATYEKDGKTYQFFTDKMKTSSTKVQLGVLVPSEDDTLTIGILEGLKNYTFTEDTAYKAITSTEPIEDGMYVYVSYTKEYDVKSSDGATTGTKTETAASHRVQVSKDDPFLSQLIGKNVGSSAITVNKVTVDEVEYTYSNVKVSYAEKLTTAAPIVVEGVVTYPKDDYSEKKENTTLYSTTEEKSIDLAGAALTYYVFPASYVTVPEYTVENLINEVYSGSKMTIATIAKLLFGEEYTEATEAEDTTAALDALYAGYNEKFEKDGVKIGLKDFVTALSTAQKALQTAETALETAETAYDTALSALEDAIKAYNDAKKASDDAAAAKKAAEDAYTAAQTATTNAKAVAGAMDAYNAAKAEYDEAYANAEHKKALEDAQAVVKTKTDAVSAAQKAYDSAKEEDKAAKQEALDAAKAELTAAEAAVAATVIKQKEAAWAETAVRAAELAEQTALQTKNTKTTEAAEKEKTLSQKVTALSNAKNTFIVKRGAFDGTPDYILTPADEGYETKKAAYDAALAALLAVNEKTDATENEKAAARKAFVDARVAFSAEVKANDDGTMPSNPAETAACPGDENYKQTGAKYDHDKALAERDTLYAEFVSVIGEEKLIEGYEYNIVYRELEDAYILEIKQAIVDKVYNEAIKANVTFKDAPKSAVEDVFERLMDNYQYCFYKEYDVKYLIPGDEGASADATVKSDSTYFERFGGSFEKFMTELAVPTTISGAAPTSYAEAEAMVKARAVAIVNERVRVFAVAEALGVKITEEQFEAFLVEKGYDTIEDENILNDLRATYQLKVLLDTILDSEKAKDETVTDTYVPTKVTYNTTYIKELVKE